MEYLVNGETANELLDAQAQVWNHTLNFINSMSLKCAVQLGIADAIHSQGQGQPLTLSKLIAALPIHPQKARHVYRLMRHLVHSGFFVHHKVGDEDAYSLTLASKLLLKDNPFNVGPLVRLLLDPFMTNPWHNLASWFQNDDETPTKTTFGMSLWDNTTRDAQFNEMLNEAMASDSRLVGDLLTSKHKDVFEGLDSLVDVGGGTGTMAKAIAKAFPHMNCIVYDRPVVVSDFRDSGNLKYVAGDMFESLPPADGVMLKWLLDDWSDEECVKILKRCREAIAKSRNGKEGGKVIAITMVLGNRDWDKKSVETQLFFDMEALAFVPGRMRDEKEMAKLFFDAGFGSYQIKPILGLRAVIEAYP